DTIDVQTADTLQVALPAYSSMSPNPVEREKNLTINGTNLDLVKGVQFKGKTTPETVFVSKSATQLVVKVPKEAAKGKIELIAYSDIRITSTDDLILVGDLPPLADFPFAIYTDALQNGFQDWSYTSVHDFNSNVNVRQGTKSIRAVYAADAQGNQYQGVTFHHNTGVSTSGYTKLEFSVFGEAGTGGKKLNVVINGAYGSPTQVTITGGEWTTYSLPLADIGNPATLSEVVLQAAGWSGTLHIDHVGLR
ncbi:MAG: IPT/TIG domain-containing protein, partial [Flavisolibacter sp.]|nr:IPT/TIG domain-containing protein [Flavisolibacter sp.]